MAKIYRGTSAEWAEQYVKTTQPKSFEATGSGEFGIGCYFWLDDLPAAIMSAVQYNGKERDWGVIQLEFDDTALHALARREAGYGSRVLEFKHSRTSPFDAMGVKPGNYVVPPDYSHLATKPTEQALHQPKIATPPPQGSYGKMQSEQFRKINADPKKYGLDGKELELIWQYDLIIGKCAADYSDDMLVQMKFANHGMSFINDRALCTRTKLMTGKKIAKAWKPVEAWKMASRQTLFGRYFEGKSSPIDLDNVLG